VLGRLLDLLRERPAQGRELVQSLAFGPGAPAAAIALVGRVLREVSPLVTLGDYLACDRFDVRERLGAIRTPTLVLTGAEDRLTPLAYGRFLAAAIPGARLVEIPGAGHFPQLEQPAAVNRAVREFLAAVPPAPHAGPAEATRPPWT
jgi:pimeloyl-ACP methyl ester carboxylesterase